VLLWRRVARIKNAHFPMVNVVIFDEWTDKGGRIKEYEV